jgi:hypothetical protein
VYGALLFAGGLVAATRLSSDVVASDAVDAVEVGELHSSNIQLGAIAMTVLRALVGFTFFHLAFWLRSQDQGTLWFAAVVGVSALASMVGNAVASLLRARVREETMLTSALFVCAGAGIAVSALSGPFGAVVLAGVLNLMAALGRLNFESIVQRDAPDANQGRAFAVFETRFQLAWAIGAFVAVALQASGTIGLLIVAVVAAGASVHLFARREQAPRAPCLSVAGDPGEPEAGRLDLVRGRHGRRIAEQRLETVLAGPVDDALHERLAAGGLLGTETDAEQPFDEDLVRRRLGPAPTGSFGDLECAAADDPDGDGIDDPVDHPDRHRDGRVEFGLERQLFL